MFKKKVEELSSEQEALFPVYREKWRAIALSTEQVESHKVSSVVANYAAINQEELHFLLCDSPYAVWNQAIIQLQRHSGSQLRNVERPIWHKLSRLRCQLETQLGRQIERKLWRKLNKQLNKKLEKQLWRQLCLQLWGQMRSQLPTEHKFYYLYPLLTIWIGDACWFDFCISVLDCNCEQSKWELFQSLIKDCGWIFPLTNTVAVCARPTLLSFDNEQRLHAEGFPAIQFPDGYSLYSHHGITLPAKYGKLRPQHWQVKWILEEDNVELRQLLIKGIGYDKVCFELQAIELDSEQEYTLLEISNNGEPVHLLKMPYPSPCFICVFTNDVLTVVSKVTRFPTAVDIRRVPSDIQSVREAVCLFYPGINPEKIFDEMRCPS